MPIDERRLLELRRYEDADAGVSERFLQQRVGPVGAFGILTEPLGERRTLGWVIAPSVGPEHGNLRRLETLVARSLAASGFPVLRIRPDLHPVHGAIGEIDISARVAEVDEAVGAVAAEAETRAVGLVGAMFGGAVASLAAERLNSPVLALIEPVTRGRQYLREIMRRQAVADVIGAGAEVQAAEGPSVSGPAPLDELEATGETSIRGLRLTKEQFDLVSAISVDEGLTSFAGRSLVVGVSPTGVVSPRLRKLHERLCALGGDAQLEVVEDPLVAPFGEYYYRNAGPVRIDTRLDLDRALAALLTAWALEASASPAAQDAAA